MTRFLPIIFISLSMGCLQPKSSVDPNIDDTGDSVNNGMGASVFDIQSGAIPEGETVSLQNVIVTSTITGEGDGFFIQDEGGGEFSGVYVYTATASGDFSEIALVGNKISLSGVTTEYYDYTELTVSSSENIQVTGEGTPVADVVSDISDWEPYEGCLVSLTDQTAMSSVNNYGEVNLSAGIAMDNLFFNFSVDNGAEFDSISGVISYGFETYKINPRSELDLEGYIPGEPAEAVTLAEIQQGDFENQSVTVENVVAVTDFVEDHVWVQDAGGGEWGGMYVYFGPWIEESITISAGDVLNISGSISEFYELTELTVNEFADAVVLSSGETPTAVTLGSAPSDWENYESVLVTLENVTVTDEMDSYGQYPLDFNLLLGNDLYSATADNGQSFETLTGLVTYSYGEYKLLPRDADDLSGESSNNNGTPTPASIMEIQDGTISTGGQVSVSGAIVTAVTPGGSLFVSDPAGGEYSGVLVYPDSISISASVGDEVSFSGEVVEFYDKTEVSVSNEADFSVTGTGTVSPTPITSIPSDWEVYEGVLVSITNVVTTTDPDQYGDCPLDLDSDGSEDGLLLDNYIYDALSTSGTAYSEIVGPIDYSYSQFRILPRDASDLVQ